MTNCSVLKACHVTSVYAHISLLQVSDYLKKQMVPPDGAEMSDDIKQMLEGHDKLVEEIFQHEDKDKNGFISHEEFSGPKHDEL